MIHPLDISPNNILTGVTDPSLFSELEEAETNHPAPRKVLESRVIYGSRTLPITNGPPVLSDFGSARIGAVHRGDVMPDFYRAPEVILGMEWGSKIDIWAAGVMVSASFICERISRVVTVS